eukprot:COSAG05_NODE_22342_length_265_cov_0.921687_1_plen_28_part_01
MHYWDVPECAEHIETSPTDTRDRSIGSV